MEKSKFSKNVIQAKELLKKLLSEKLDKRIKNLELNNDKEILALSLLSNSSNDFINNLNNYSNIISNKEITVPKLDLKEIENNNNNNELDGILKNSILKNKRNKERPVSTIFNYETSKTKVIFCQKGLNKNSILFETPNCENKLKSFIPHKSGHKKETKLNKTFVKLDCNHLLNDNNNKKIKNMKCLTERLNKDIPKTPLRLNLTKNIVNNKNNKLLNSTKTIKKENKVKKNPNKTTLNFFTKKNKNFETEKSSNSKINSRKTKTPEKRKVANEIKRHEKNLKSLCESMLIDVNKDELLVNNNKVIISGSIPELYNKNEERDTKKYQNNFKNCIQYFLPFLTIAEIFELCKAKKEILKLILNLKIDKIEKSIDSINSILKSLNSKNNKNLILPKELKPFELNQNSQKAIALLNSLSKVSFIKSIKNCDIKPLNKNNNIKKIILLFDLYFISIGRKNILNSLNSDNNKKIQYICSYFKSNKNKLIGNIIEIDLKNKKFDDFIINNLFEYSKEDLDIINPKNYKKINKDIAIFVFIIKNILDFIGISNIKQDNKNNEQKISFVLKSRLNAQNFILDKLNQILNKFN